VRRISADGAADIEDELAVERWLRIIVNGRELMAVMASPGHEDELGAGLALTQGWIRSRRDLLRVTLRADADKGDTVRIVVPVELSLAIGERLSARGSCGGWVLSDEELPEIAGCEPTASADRLGEMARSLTAAQQLYKRTGGVHGAGVFRADGELVAAREDVGRHNAVDKVIGHCLLAGEAVDDKVLVVSGRASQEIVGKAARAGVAILASMSAPTAAAVDAAQRCGLTLVGFLRGRRMNVYAHPRRIVV